MKIFPDPPPKTNFKSSLKQFFIYLAIFLFIGIILSGIKSSIIEEYLEDNYNDIYDSAYSEGFNEAYDQGYENGYYDGYHDGYVCWNCGGYLSKHTAECGLCRDCQSGTITTCVFCDTPTFDWNTTYGYTVCHKCLGEAWEKTDLEEFLHEFNESR